ncbi:MAG: 30S ribosomal protein S17 [Candidatus Absconditabacteria bacterium]|nr:30S ribosomal protein S17 [Candidatus Absconditabacteria bacterium]MDD3868412.1 30S ribosomal protein S17 [Candidatus Absconditabacteria bacterium]MDD4714064.1 30S ribosomal protein S17 [Candidatus Absconditabacteria bacterium]
MTIIGEKNIKELIGEVVSDKMSKTCVVMVKSVKVHPIYKKRFVVKKKYYAHDENLQVKLGDKVKIRSISPLSKLKKWKVVEIV